VDYQAEYEAFAKQVEDEFRRNGYTRYCVETADAGDVDEDGIAKYLKELESAEDEKPMQRYLEEHPQLVLGELGAQCRWVIPQKSLGGEYVPDFLVARLDSTGVVWTLIELESPRVLLFTEGRQRKQLSKGMNQINDWRRWLANNQDTARRARSRNGLGLVGITSMARGIVIIGRADQRTDDDRERIQQIMFQQQITIHSYDWLAREAKQRIENRRQHPLQACDECPA
jgi:hypothetical protein